MAKIGWLVNRLRAMSVPEIMWRFSQKSKQKKEEKVYKSRPVLVTDAVFNKGLKNLSPKHELLHINYKNSKFSLARSITLLGGYNYENYKKNWNAGFQTGNSWPRSFSYSIEYKQRDDIGDARTNWELNRHIQFALLAKDYFASGKKEYLDEFIELFTNWNEENPFLWGISWISVMEVAIRVSNWCYTYCFLNEASDVPAEILERLRIGIINMTDYIAQHYSRYSSANNHLIVEAYAIGQSGILLQHKPWVDLSVSILTRELPLQNYTDGVNKELSLHYQSFYMESMGLMMRLLMKNNIIVPDSWEPMLSKMCKYLADCMGVHGEVIEFGDNDEGKILDLCGSKFNHYTYVLGLLSCLLPQKYTQIESSCVCEILCWLFTHTELKKANLKALYLPKESVCYREGGNSILRSKDGSVLIGIDHAALGFGSIAAHGHADALSFQMYVDGQPLLLDPGTYIYHCNLPSRNAYRKTMNHNTAVVADKDQSEMLGAFLWGKRAQCKLLDYQASGDAIVLKASHDGYAPEIHTRTFEFNGVDELKITDQFLTNKNKKLNFILSPNTIIYRDADEMKVQLRLGKKSIWMSFQGDVALELGTRKVSVSEKYGVQCEASALIIWTNGLSITTTILLN